MSATYIVKKILILDFGSQYTQLIAKDVSAKSALFELWAWDVTEDQIRNFEPNSIILSVVPESVTERGSAHAHRNTYFNAGVPSLDFYWYANHAHQNLVARYKVQISGGLLCGNKKLLSASTIFDDIMELKTKQINGTPY